MTLPRPPRPRRVVVLDDYQRVAASTADWSVLGPEVELDIVHEHLGDPDAVVARLRGADVVCIMRERTPFPRTLFERLPELRLLVNTGMHNAAVDLDAARDHGVTVCGTEGVLHGTAELTWALLLALARRLPEEDAAVRAGGWQRHVGTLLRGRTLGLVGLGQLGAIVAGYGLAFGMDVVAWSHHLTDTRAEEVGVRRVERDELLAGSDVVSIHVRLGERTRGLIGERELAAMRSNALLINTSRAGIVDHDALRHALETGAIAGAALDVYPREPLPPDDPLRTLPNTVLAPHIGFVTEETYRVYYRQSVEAIVAWAAGAPIRVMT